MRCWSCDRENLSSARFCAVCGARLGCTACGTPRRAGQRTCGACGLRCYETEHFRLHYALGSFAEQNLIALGIRLESAREIIAGLLALDLARGPIADVYLAETLEDPRRPGVALAEAYAVPRRLEIHAVYQPEVPGNGLEGALLLLVIASAMGDSRPRTPLIVDGILALLLQRSGSFPTHAEVTTTVAQLKNQGTLPALTSMLGGPTPITKEFYYAASASFVAFLIRAHGAAAVREYLRRLGAEEPDAAAIAAFGRSLAAEEEAWQKTLPASRKGQTLWAIKLALSYLRPYKWQAAEIMLYIAIGVGFGMMLAKMQGYLLDQALLPQDRRMLFTLMGILLGAYVISQITGLRSAYVGAQMQSKVGADMSRRLFSIVQYLHIGFFQRMNTGDIISRATADVGMLEAVIAGVIFAGYTMLLTLVSALTLILLTDWRLSIVALVGMPLFILTGFLFGPATRRASLERQQRLAGLVSALHENMAAMPVVKAFSLQERMIDDYSQTIGRLRQAVVRAIFLGSLFGVSSGAITYAITLTVFGAGGWLVTGGDLSVGTLFTFLALMAQLIGPMQSVSGIFATINRAAPALGRVQELLEAESSIEDGPDARPVGRLSQEIRVEDVTFTYTGRQTVIDKLSLVIPAGKRVALVGPSGCGKSTFLSLLMRFYDPQSGRITIDNVDLRDATLASLRGQMGIVLQESFLFNMSIRENIRLGNLAATDAEVEAAAQAAEIHEQIEALPAGYDTVVGERGGQLSGGQRQRVAIARAIVRDPAILLLDEATSALDPGTEAAINQALERVGEGRTTIFVTHRLSSVVNADLIYVMNQGVLVEQGTHAELLQRRGLYAYLWEQQGGMGAAAEAADGNGAAAELFPSLTTANGSMVEVRHGG